ncbi:MAG: hypothetical protein DHS20C01_28850 [marine bacterium B5-7]|nr:MAG: hypothetical protein DHS20C01_28850 [marine bacterium B5-7]
MKQPFDEDSAELSIMLQWWRDLENDKGARAELRRCTSPEAVMLHPAYARMHYRLASSLSGQWNWEYRLAAVAGLLAHVRKPTKKFLAEEMGGRKPVVSELRFRRLLQCKPDELYGRMIRVLRMLDNTANTQDLIRSVFHWNDRVRKRWALKYFANLPTQETA